MIKSMIIGLCDSGALQIVLHGNVPDVVKRKKCNLLYFQGDRRRIEEKAAFQKFTTHSRVVLHFYYYENFSWIVWNDVKPKTCHCNADPLVITLLCITWNLQERIEWRLHLALLNCFCCYKIGATSEFVVLGWNVNTQNMPVRIEFNFVNFSE